MMKMTSKVFLCGAVAAAAMQAAAAATAATATHKAAIFGFIIPFSTGGQYSTSRRHREGR